MWRRYELAKVGIGAAPVFNEEQGFSARSRDRAISWRPAAALHSGKLIVRLKSQQRPPAETLFTNRQRQGNTKSGRRLPRWNAAEQEP
jgi:hypothetical protein